MKKTKKKVLGFIYLAFVAVMTTVATYIPAPNAVAESTATDTIKVVVYDKFPQVTITKPTDSSYIVDPSLEIGISFENVSHADFTLQYTRDGVDYGYVVETFEPTENVDPDLQIASGEVVLNAIDLDSYGGYGEYTLTATAKGVREYDEDIVSFVYVPLNAKIIGTADNYDPIAEVGYSSDVSKIFLQVYDKKGNPIFDEPIEYTVISAGVVGSKEFNLPFESYGVVTGDYKLSVTGESIDGDPLGPFLLPFHYDQKPNPDVPKTGFFAGNLSTSKTDYAITGLIVFAVAAVCGFVIVLNRKPQAKSRRRR